MLYELNFPIFGIRIKLFLINITENNLFIKLNELWIITRSGELIRGNLPLVICHVRKRIRKRTKMKVSHSIKADHVGIFNELPNIEGKPVKGTNFRVKKREIFGTGLIRC